ncbi:MAG TPA: ERAP1-like C-terminal domain-containing protein, partial [Candidatus Saccharimonadales bacterium]
AVPALFDKRQAKVTLPTDEFVRVNQGAVGHYIVRYTNPKHANEIAKLVSNKQLGAAERLMLLSDSSMLARAGSQPFDATLKLLEHYTSEDSESVWDIMALILADARRFIDEDPKLEDSIKALIRELIETQYTRLGWEEKPNEPSQDTKLRGTIIGLGVYAEHPEILARALELFETYKKDNKAVNPELRGIIFGAAVRHNSGNAFEYLIKLDETTSNVDLKQEIIGSLTLTRQDKQIATLLERLKDSDQVRQQDVDHWLVYMLRSRYSRKQSWKWLRDNWDWIEKTFSGDKSYDYFPRYAASAFNTRPLMEEYKDFFGPKKDQVVLARNITMGIEEIGNRVAWLERDLACVQNYFKSRP